MENSIRTENVQTGTMMGVGIGASDSIVTTTKTRLLAFKAKPYPSRKSLNTTGESIIKKTGPPHVVKRNSVDSIEEMITT